MIGIGKSCIFLFVFLIFFVLSSLVAYSHSGGTDSSGCHRQSNTGGRHCHGSSNRNSSDYKTKKLLIITGVVLGSLVALVFIDNFKRNRKTAMCNEFCLQVIPELDSEVSLQEISLQFVYKR